ncbi:hypothetical protein [Dactylosporangium sp. CA-139066]|uniref:hypothetical protein n=1 Tax=Dactylosporangium sp. CA-139066 TaxID=3239930 RepID=UPI003D92DC54
MAGYSSGGTAVWHYRCYVRDLSGRAVQVRRGGFTSQTAAQAADRAAQIRRHRQRVRATLRAAYNAAIRDGMVIDNPARRVEMPTARRPHAVVWTPGRVQQWRADGHRPAVAVWTTAQLAWFLDTVADDPLLPLWWLIALRERTAPR